MKKLDHEVVSAAPTRCRVRISGRVYELSVSTMIHAVRWDGVSREADGTPKVEADLRYWYTLALAQED